MATTLEDARDALDRASPERADVPVEKLYLELSEAERRMLARRLHDDVGQSLTGIALLLRALTDRLEHVVPEEAKAVSAISASLRETIGGVRRVSRSLMTPLWSGADLRGSLAEVVAQTAAAMGVRHDLKTSGAVDVEDRGAIAVLCTITHGTIVDAAERGQATHVVVRLNLESDVGSLEIDDDRSSPIEGSDAPEVTQYRVALLGGELVVHRRAERGQRLVCTFPLAR